MQVPLELTFRNMDHSPELEADIRERAAKLDEFYDRITACRVVVEAPHHHHREGNVYHVRIYLSVPGHDIAVDRDPDVHHSHEDLRTAIRDAFKAARRQLQDVARKLRGDVKAHELPAQGRITKLLPSADDPSDGYGFLETPDGREVYFHANSLLDATFEDLDVGAELRFVEEEGDKGPQATSVRPM